MIRNGRISRSFTGKQILWAEGKLEGIVEHCVVDVRREWWLWKRM